MTGFVLRIIGLATGEPTAHDGQWVVRFDPDAHGGRGHVTTTNRRDQAMRFETAAEALTTYRMESVVQPTRPDGRPNKPMTAYTVKVEPW